MTSDRLSMTFAALANPTRRAILAHLANGEASVNQLADRRAQYRPCAINAEPLAEVSTWAEQYRTIWEARFDQLDDYLQHLQTDTKDDHHEPTPER